MSSTTSSPAQFTWSWAAVETAKAAWAMIWTIGVASVEVIVATCKGIYRRILTPIGHFFRAAWAGVIGRDWTGQVGALSTIAGIATAMTWLLFFVSPAGAPMTAVAIAIAQILGGTLLAYLAGRRSP